MNPGKPETVAYVSVVHPLHDHRFLYKQCKGLVDHGFTVDYFVQAEQPCVLQGVTIRPLKEYASRWRRFMSIWRLHKPLRQGRYDAVHLVDPELLPLGILLKLTTRSAVIFDAHEDYVEFIKHKHYLHGFVSRLMSLGIKLLLAFSARVLDGMIFADQGTADTLNMPEFKKGFFYNFPMLSLFPETPTDWSDRRYDVVYLGTMSRTSGIFVMLQAIALLAQKRPRVRCLFIGEPGGYLKEEVTAHVRQLNIESNVEFTGRVPHGQVPGRLQNCRVGLIGLMNLPKFHKNIATKMFEYMACAIPIVSSDLPPERRFMNDPEHGLFVPPEDPKSMADAIDRILSDPEMAARMARNCRRQILEKGYYAEKEIDGLVAYYRSILDRRRKRPCGN
jgi:glycosyltransferase involved in cell wall biosynthesis